MRRCAMVVLTLAAAFSPARGQATPPAEVETYPYEGQVTGDNVYVRSGPGLDAVYRCAQISSPARVTVVGKKDQWLKIMPVAGCFCTVSKEYVKRDAAGDGGTVTGDNVRVYAAGTLRSPGTHLIGRLVEGDRVKVLGEVDDHYKIAPPGGAYYWIAAEYVRRTGASEAPEEVVVVGPPTTRPTEGVGTSTTRVVRPTEPPEKVQAAVAAFEAAEKALAAEYARPVEQRDLDGLLAKYEAIGVGEEHYLRPAVAARVEFLKLAIRQREEVAALDKLVEEARAKQRDYEMRRTKMEIETTTRRAVLAYAAEGVLTASAIFPGGATSPKRYLVRDPKTLRVQAYVQCTTGAVDLSEAVGKHVGIHGTTMFDEAISLDVVEAEKVVVLDEGVEMPTPPTPTVKPLPPPKPAPKPAPKPVSTTPPEPATRPAPRPPAPPEPTTKPAAKPPDSPATRPASPEVKEPEAAPERPILDESVPPEEPAPATQPATAPAEAAVPAPPLPPTGLPMVKPETQPAKGTVNAEEYK